MGGLIEKIDDSICAIWHNLYCPDNFTFTFSHYKANTSYDDICIINIAMEYVNLVCMHVHVSCLLMPVLYLLFIHCHHAAQTIWKEAQIYSK